MTYIVQIDSKVREAQSDEVARIEEIRAENAALAQAVTDREAAKASALAKLKALGLTAEEAQAIAGI